MRLQNYKMCWIVDPLDGTKEFIKRVPHFTVNIALVEGDTPVMGVVCTPAAATIHFAAKGQGAFVRCMPQSQPALTNSSLNVKPSVQIKMHGLRCSEYSQAVLRAGVRCAVIVRRLRAGHSQMMTSKCSARTTTQQQLRSTLWLVPAT